VPPRDKNGKQWPMFFTRGGGLEELSKKSHSPVNSKNHTPINFNQKQVSSNGMKHNMTLEPNSSKAAKVFTSGGFQGGE
jgi:hypothetical protein